MCGFVVVVLEGGVCFFVFVHVCMCGFLRRIKAVFTAGSAKVMVNFFLLPLKVNTKVLCAGET